MNFVCGEITGIRPARGQRPGKVGGATKIISLDLLTDHRPGDKVLVGEGVALGKVGESSP